VQVRLITATDLVKDKETDSDDDITNQRRPEDPSPPVHWIGINGSAWNKGKQLNIG